MGVTLTLIKTHLLSLLTLTVISGTQLLEDVTGVSRALLSQMVFVQELTTIMIQTALTLTGTRIDAEIVLRVIR